MNLYLCSSLKDSYVHNGLLVPGFRDGAYKVPYKNFINKLSRLTHREMISSKFNIIDGSAGEATQLRAIIPVPHGWGGERFKEVALREWAKNPSSDIVVAAYLSANEDESFLSPGWQGSRRHSR